MGKGGEGGERVRIGNSSALIAMKKLEKWLSGHKRLSTWTVLRCAQKDSAKRDCT